MHTELRCTVNHTSDLKISYYIKKTPEGKIQQWSTRHTRDGVITADFQVNKIYALLWYHAPESGDSVPTFRDSLSGPVFKGQEIQLCGKSGQWLHQDQDRGIWRALADVVMSFLLKFHYNCTQVSINNNIFKNINLYTPNVNYSWRNAPLTSKVAFYIIFQQI